MKEFCRVYKGLILDEDLSIYYDDTERGYEVPVMCQTSWKTLRLLVPSLTVVESECFSFAEVTKIVDFISRSKDLILSAAYDDHLDMGYFACNIESSAVYGKLKQLIQYCMKSLTGKVNRQRVDVGEFEISNIDYSCLIKIDEEYCKVLISLPEWLCEKGFCGKLRDYLLKAVSECTRVAILAKVDDSYVCNVCGLEYRATEVGGDLSVCLGGKEFLNRVEDCPWERVEDICSMMGSWSLE